MLEDFFIIKMTLKYFPVIYRKQFYSNQRGMSRLFWGYKQKKRAFRVFNILNALVLLCSCASPHQGAPVSDRNSPPSNKLTQHIVSSGETLFSIAWRYGRDYKKLASYNGISRPYVIYPGQNIRLNAPRQVVVNKSKEVKSNVKSLTPAKTTMPRSKTTTKVVKPVRPITKILRSNKSIRWIWPAKGKILASFSSQSALNKGVDIAGKLGEPVYSAADGLVVYAGSGLRGYGNLLIIKHNEKYLSAYAHNRKLLVGEGTTVKGGQKIAEIGSSGTNKNKLHFEIRRDGKPVDPTRYLPKR